ncbi:MAG TPA: zinc-binding dehydrogenase [Chloroflexota bacterium]
MAATMQAAILAELQQPLIVDDVQLPDELLYGQALVRVHCSTICGSQLGEIDGVKGPDRFLPHLLGHEGAGVVEGIGPGVSRVRPGDHVVLHWMKAAGVDAATPRYRWRGRDVNAGWVTTFNEAAVVSENRLTPIPDGLDFGVASLLGCAVTTGLGVLANDAGLRAGESVVVFGAGGVGLNVIQGAALGGAFPVVAVDLYDDKLALAKWLGASHTFNARQSDTPERLCGLLGSGADVIVETTGSARVIEQAYELAGPQGRTVLVGVPRTGDKICIDSLPLHFGKTLIGSHGGGSRPDHDIPRYVALHQAGKLDLQSLIGARVALDQVNEAIDGVRGGAFAGRCLIDMSPTEVGA